MIAHREIETLFQRLKYYLPIPAVIATITFAKTLSRHAFPGQSANLISEAAGCIPPSGVDHPLFSLLARAIASVDIFPLTIQLNLFSALCGVLCAMLIYHIVARTILFFACEDAGGSQIDLATECANTGGNQPSELTPEVAEYNSRVFRIALIGGLVAAFALTFTVPGWAASTRLDTGMFHLLLALASIALFPFKTSRFFLFQCFLSTLFFTLGLHESAAFILILPCFFYFLFNLIFGSPNRALTGGVVLASILAATACSISAYQHNCADTTIPFASLLKSYFYALPSHHLRQLLSFLPRSGWIQLLIQAVLPAAIILFGSQSLYKDKKPASVAALCLLGLAITPGLLNLSFCPALLLKGSSHTFSYAIIAAATGMAIAAALIIIKKDPFDENENFEDEIDWWKENSLQRIRILSWAVLPVLLTLLLLAPWRSFPAVNPDAGSFADESSRQILEAMRGRTLLITNGILDNHLLTQAFIRKQPLMLISLDPVPNKKLIAHINTAIERSPLFQKLNRTRLQNALSIGTVQFALEWLKSDSDAEKKAMIFATPELWLASGYSPIPEGFAFGGSRPSEEPNFKMLLQQQSNFTARAVTLLAERENDQVQTAYLRSFLRLKAGYAANELGVLFEEHSHSEEAYTIYESATRIDPDNVSAAVNLCALNLKHALHPEKQEILRKRVENILNQAKLQSAPILAIIQKYGTIDQPQFYLQQTAMWTMRGAKTVSKAKANKALALSNQTGISSLKESALVYLHAGETEKAEECYTAILEIDSSDSHALTGMCNIMINKSDTVETEKWINLALKSGVPQQSLRYQQIALAILKGDKIQAKELLYAATKEVPEDLRYWTMLSDILLELGDIQLVEFKVLPAMQSALKNANHFLVHAVKGQLLRKKGPEFYREARLSFLNALSLNAALPDLWMDVLQLDMSINNPSFKESDARNLLKLDPEHPFANYLMGSSLLERGALPQSEDFLRHSIEKTPTAMACNDLAENLRLQRKLGEAENFARRSLELDPQLLPSLDTLASVLYDAEKWSEAAQTASKTVEANPQHLAYQLTLLRAQIKTGDKAGVRQRTSALKALHYEIPDALKNQIKDILHPPPTQHHTP